MTNSNLIDSDRLATTMRARIFKPYSKQLLIANLRGTLEAQDSYTELNCDGLGRVRTFANFLMHADGGDVTERSRIRRMLLEGYPQRNETRTQVFQLAGCAWRCWYCYVDEDRLSGDPRVGKWMNCDELVDLYFKGENPPDVLDLSGGQPDLVPIWPGLMLEALRRSGKERHVFLRSEDNLTFPLSADPAEGKHYEELIAWGKYSRIGCFKGFDEASFSQNTGAKPEFFARQMEVAKSIVERGISFFAHATFTAVPDERIGQKVGKFIDGLQRVHHYLPLRVVPLTIRAVPAWAGRRVGAQGDSQSGQDMALDAWFNEICKRFSLNDRSKTFEEISLRD